MEIQNLKFKIQNSISRPPIVVVMGHIDHGKTTLLDFIRKTNLAAKEAGGITQSIGAYVIAHHSPQQTDLATGQAKLITFIDTPGHEAFSKMRQRGAKVADLGILVVAADEGVKPQTKEAIEILKGSQTPFIVAINKIDKPNADVERVKQDLMQAGILLEGFGGNISWQAISAKSGQGIDELLDLILLAAEMEELTYNPTAKAKGVIIESKMDSRRGLTVIAIVKDGILRVGEEIVTPSATGKIKILENFLGKRVESLEPSSPALILGFDNLPQIGEEFLAGKIELWEIQPSKVKTSKTEPEISVAENMEMINLVLKADVSGSLEALAEVIKTIPNIKIISESVGEITDGDVKSALSTKAVIIGFKVGTNKAAENLAKAQDIKIITSDVIYELLDNLKAELKTLAKIVISAKLEILGVFGKKSGSAKGGRQIIGGRVIAGNFRNNARVKIQRQEQIIGEGKIINLQRQKQDVNQINEGEEAGILLESDTIIETGDQLII